MQISTANFYNRAALQMSKLNADANRLQTEISTKRLNVASQDSTAWMMLGGIKKDDADAAAFGANITLSRGLLAQSDTALGNADERLVRVRELAVRASNETLNDKDKAAIAVELGEIREGLLGIANSRDVRGHPIFGGTGETAFDKDALGVITYTGNESIATVRIGEASEIQVGLDGSRVFGGAGGGVDVFAMIDALKVAMEKPTDPVADPGNTAFAASVRTALTQLDKAEAQVTSARASSGARAARVEIEATQLDTIGLDREEARIALEATDIPTAMVEFQKTMTILQATQASVAKLAGLSLFDYLR